MADQNTAGSGLKRLSLYERHQAGGARFAPFAGWEMPLRYSGIVTEHEIVRSKVGIFDVSHLGRAWLRGPQAAEQLRSVTTFDVTTMPVGTAHYSLYCNEEGGIADDVYIYHLDEERWLIVHNAANADADFARLQAITGADATEFTEETVMLAVQGPEALALLATVLGDIWNQLEQHDCAELEWRGTNVLIARTGYTGEDGGECIIAADRAEELWDAFIEGGANPTGLGARDSLRLEAALPLHGNDIDATTNPFEAGLGFAVSLDDEAPFTGRDALVTAKERPRTRRLTCMQARDRGVLRPHFPVQKPDGGDTITELTSGSFSPRLRLGIGMAYLPVDLAKPGTIFEVDVRGRALPVEVVRRPFYRKSRQS